MSKKCGNSRVVSRGYFPESNSSGELYVYVGRQFLRACHFLYFELFFFFVLFCGKESFFIIIANKLYSRIGRFTLH